MQVQMQNIHLHLYYNSSGPWRIHWLTWKIHFAKALVEMQKNPQTEFTTMIPLTSLFNG